MRIIISLILIIIVNVKQSYSQVHNCNIYIVYDKYSSINLDKIPDTIKENNIGHDSIHNIYAHSIIITSCYGSGSYLLYKNGKINQEGAFVDAASNDTLYGYLHSMDENGLIKDYKICYHYPRKDGVWKYYNDSGKLIRKETWDNGNLYKKEEY